MGLQGEPNSLSTQFRVHNQAEIGKKQVIRKNDDELVAIIYPKKKQPIQQQQKFKPRSCRFCKQLNCLEFDKKWYCLICE